MGINVIPAARNRWTSQRIQPADESRLAMPVVRTDLDLFALEYGAPLKPWSFAVPEAGTNFVWGAASDDPEAMAIRWGKGWCDLTGTHIWLQAEIDSSVPTEWRFVLHTRKGRKTLRKFTVKPGASRVCENLGQFRELSLSDGGVELVVKGAGADVAVKSLVVAPGPVPISVRRRFVLAERPWRAALSLRYRSGYTVDVNGRRVAQGKPLSPGGNAFHVVTDELVAGTNEVVISFDGNSGYDRTRWMAAELFAVDPSGETHLFVCDDRWQAKVGEGDWGKVRAIGRMGFHRMRSGLVVSEGSMPLHAGPLYVTPRGTAWPVFDSDRAVTFDVALPPGLADAVVTAVASNSFTHAIAATVSRTGAGPLSFTGLEPGAYTLVWSVARGGRVCDRDENEMLVTGPIAFDEVPYADFETELVKRLRKIQEVDCTAKPEEDMFVDHTGYFSGLSLDVGRLNEENGIRFRETGPSEWDLFAYKIEVGELGAPHIVEVDYPDTHEQALFVSVNETFDMPFCCNSLPEGSRGWCNGTGSVVSGGVMPLTGKKRTMRIVFFPGSRNITVLFENGRTGTRAAACGFRVYQVEGGLPALKLPKTERLFANHNERPIFMQWGGAVNPAIHSIVREYRDRFWAATWLAIVNRLQCLKFLGHNASVEGAYMYYNNFKTESGESADLHPEFDFLVPMLKMYKANGIRAILSYEYTAAPKLLWGGLRDTSDRDVAAGKPTISQVDRHGRQIVLGHGGGGVDFMNPTVIGSMTNVLGEIYRRYAPYGVEGLFVVTEGCSWQPQYVPLRWAGDPDETGYGDLPFGLFEKETGFWMEEGSGPGGSGVSPLCQRFANRYAAVHANPETLAKWRRWRNEQKRVAHERLRSVVSGGEHPWKYYVVPNVTSDATGANPFNDTAATAADRDAYFGRETDALGYGKDLYPPDGDLALVPKLDYLRQHEIPGYGVIMSESAQARVRDYDRAYLTPIGLNEHNRNRMGAAKRWWWRSYDDNIFDTKPAGEFGYFDCVGLCAVHTPRELFHTWLDMNSVTGDSDESRRFLTGFYATPVCASEPFPGVTGVTAHRFGDAVQLVNDTPYAVRGTLSLAAPATDALTGRTLRGETAYELRPFGITVLTTEDPAANLKGAFAFGAEDAATVRAERRELLTVGQLADRIDAAALGRVRDAKTDYDACRAMRAYEVLTALCDWRAAKGCLANQKRFEKLLAETGVVRVDCGKTTDTVDEEGNLWLPDQRYYGFAAYGNEHAGFYDRGHVAISGTKVESVYRTEVTTRHLPAVYTFPVPDGVYEVRVLYADCWNKEPGVWQTLKVGTDVRRYDTVRDVGRCAAGVHVFRDVRPENGRITVTLEFGIINGIEIFKRSKGGK